MKNISEKQIRAVEKQLNFVKLYSNKGLPIGQIPVTEETPVSLKRNYIFETEWEK